MRSACSPDRSGEPPGAPPVPCAAGPAAAEGSDLRDEEGHLIAYVLVKTVGHLLWLAATQEQGRRDRLVAEGMISPDDMNLVQVIDDPAKITTAIFDHYEARGFAPSAEEREIQLNL